MLENFVSIQSLYTSSLMSFLQWIVGIVTLTEESILFKMTVEADKDIIEVITEERSIARAGNGKENKGSNQI